MGARASLDSQRFLAHVERIDRMVAERGVQPPAFNPPVQRVGLREAEPSVVEKALALGGLFVKARTYESPDVCPAGDVVLLDGNPLENIRITRQIRGVVLYAKYYNRSALDTLLRSAVEIVRVEDLIQPRVERMCATARQVLRRHPDRGVVPQDCQRSSKLQARCPRG
jgi:hypothetical protein